jgi:uncharacterized membrane protein YuzA (DUF378 family)
MKLIDVAAAMLVVVGALNWGLVAVARFDLVAALFWKRVHSRCMQPTSHHA